MKTAKTGALGFSKHALSQAIKPWFFLCASASVLFAASPLMAGPSVSEVISEVRSNIMSELAPKVPGLSIAVEHDGQIVWSEGFGFADLEAKKPVTTQSLFRIASVAKPMTAAGLMLLVESGKVDLDANIHRYVPDYPDKGHPFTTRQLAGHLAGIRHYKGDEFYLNQHFSHLKDALQIFENDPLLSVPGEKYKYSSYGYNLIGVIMESASGEDFLSYMRKAVFTPLAMANTIPDDATRISPRRTRFYKSKPGGGFELEPDVDLSCKWPAGGFLSTPEDMVRFGAAHLQPGFLKRSSLDALFTPQKTSDGKETAYGIGWEIRKDKKGRPVYMHTGGGVGGTSVLLIQPDSRVVLALVANCTDAPLGKANPALIIKAFSALFGTN